MASERSPHTVHIVDDDPAVLHSTAVLFGSLGFQTERYSHASALLDEVGNLAPGCVVMDVRMPGIDGVEGQRRLAGARSDLPVILITGDGDIRLAVRCLQAGAADFLEKPFEPEELVASVRSALTRPVKNRVSCDAAERLALLTDRERDVLTLIVEGGTNKEIARRLGNSHRTIEIHRAHIMAKIGAHTVAQLIRFAISAGM